MKEKREILVESVTLTIIYVKDGTFQMADKDGHDTKPVHYERNPAHFKSDNLPIESVTLDNCHRLISELNRLTGLYLRLPSEDECEYVPLGGIYSHGYALQ